MIIFRVKSFFNSSLSKAINRSYANESHDLSKILSDKPSIARTIAERDMLYIREPEMPSNPKLLKVSLLGAPNAGKSSLLNRLMNRRISSVSKKINTTRNRINAVLTDQETQIIILDTPGINTFRKSKQQNLERQMITDPHSSLWESDLVLVVHDCSNEYSHETLDSEIIKCLFAHPDKEAILVLNKTDKLKNKKKLFDLVAALTGGCLNGKEFMPKENNKLFCDRRSFRDCEYEALFAKTAEKMNLKLNSPKTEKMKKLLEDLKSCEEYLLKNQSLLTVNESSLMSLEKLESNNTDCHPPNKTLLSLNNENNDLNLVSSIINATNSSNGVNQLRRIEDISPLEFKRDILETTDWHLYYKKLSSLSTLVRGKTYWPYFNQVFMISAKLNDGIDDLKRYMFSRARPAQWLFSRNMLTDQMPQEIAEQCVREKLLEYLAEEVPYELGIKVSHWDLDDNDCLNIMITVFPGTTKYKYKRHVTELFKDHGKILKRISEESHQEMLNTFQCEIKFKLIVSTQNTNEF